MGFPNLFIAVPADVLAPSCARPSTGTELLEKKTRHLFQSYPFYPLSGPGDVIQNADICQHDE